MPRVNVIIACHNPARPVGRAVASVVGGNPEAAVTVVCHNTSIDSIAASIDHDVEFLELHDGIKSASGPFEHGMEASDAEFVSIMGSDDTLEPGAVAHWLRLADSTGADVVQTRLLLEGAIVRTPPVRPWLSGLADPVRDRLCYRSAPLGLVSREIRAATGARLVGGAPVGGDVPYVTKLWFQSKVAVQRSGPGYIIGESATDRVTYTDRPITVELAFVLHLLDDPWFVSLGRRERVSICAKLIRIHLFGVILNRSGPAWWTDTERASLAHVARRLLEAGPGVDRRLSVADNDLLRAILSRSASAEKMMSLARARRRHGRPATVVSSDPRYMFATEAPLRMMAASLLVK